MMKYDVKAAKRFLKRFNVVIVIVVVEIITTEYQIWILTAKKVNDANDYKKEFNLVICITMGCFYLNPLNL